MRNHTHTIHSAPAKHLRILLARNPVVSHAIHLAHSLIIYSVALPHGIENGCAVCRFAEPHEHLRVVQTTSSASHHTTRNVLCLVYHEVTDHRIERANRCGGQIPHLCPNRIRNARKMHRLIEPLASHDET